MKTFYHGVGQKLLFPDYHFVDEDYGFSINCPLSTTSSITTETGIRFRSGTISELELSPLNAGILSPRDDTTREENVDDMVFDNIHVYRQYSDDQVKKSKLKSSRSTNLVINDGDEQINTIELNMSPKRTLSSDGSEF